MKKYRVGIIGCGAIFMVHVYPLHMLENVEIKAVCDIKPQARELAARLFNCDAYENYEDMLKRDDLDVIHVLTPHYLHAPMVIAAANSGRHVLTEKPMSISVEEAKAKIEAAKRNNVTIGVISQNRYNSASVAIKEAIDNGSLGKVLGQRILLSWFKPDSYYASSDWHGTWDKEGGSLIEDGKIIGFQVAFRSNYYRGVWLSQLRPATVIVDGETFSGEQITWTIGRRTYEQAELSKYGDTHWALLEPAVLTVRKPGGLTQGFHDLEVKYAYSCSYFPPTMDELMVAISSGPLTRRLLLV